MLMRDQPMSYTTVAGKREGTTILKLTGPLILSSLFGFQEEFRAMKPPVLIVDLSETPYMDSAGLGLIMNYYVSAANSGRQFLLAGANDRIHALLGLTRVSVLLRLFPSVEDAEASL
jgi:anti-sigma B factor antagonist